MAKERLINTRFWNDGWVRSVNPLDRYLYLYLLTNEYTNISGIYELPIQTIAYGSGLDERDLKHTMLPRLEPKVFYKDGWVIITKFPNYQRLKSDSVVEGIKRELDSVPKSVLEFAKERGYGDGLGIIPPSSHIPNLTKLNLTKPIGEEVATPPTPYELSKDFFLEGETYRSIYTEFCEKIPNSLVDREFKKFCLYWTEPSKNGRKQRWEQQSTFEVRRRLYNWFSKMAEGKQTINKGRGLEV